MRAAFYLFNESFRYPANTPAEQIQANIEGLALDYDYIRQYKDRDCIKKHDSIYDEYLFEDLTVADILYSGKGKGIFNRDIVEHLRTVIDKSESDDIEPLEVIRDLLQAHNEDNVWGLLCLHKIESVDEKYLVYSKHNWLDFHRYFLGLYPKDAPFFFQECTKYFPDLFLHERNQHTIISVFPLFVKKMIQHLTYLNDDFSDCKVNPYNRNETLQRFSAYCNLDEVASTEGNANRKKDFTFEFMNAKKQMEKICCEPHLKLSRSDKYPGDSEYYYHRIYFHEGKKDIADGRILIGHIGKHL